MKHCHLFWGRRLLCILLCLLVFPLPCRAAQETRPIHILLIGKDAEDGCARSDAMILCSFQPERNTLTLTSLLRDWYVPIPGCGSDRLNAAYAYGGMPLLKQTLTENLGIAVDGCLEVDFTGFSGVIDLLGGVTLDLRQDEADTINASVPGNLTAGRNRLTGAQTLAYTRIRKLDADGDFSRTRRQRAVLSALLASCKNGQLRSLLSSARQALSLIRTDISRRQVMEYVRVILPGLKGMHISEQYLPAEGTYAYRTIRDMSVIVADMTRNRQYWEKSMA